jgi:hypothetical protein
MQSVEPFFSRYQGTGPPIRLSGATGGAAGRIRICSSSMSRLGLQPSPPRNRSLPEPVVNAFRAGAKGIFLFSHTPPVLLCRRFHSVFLRSVADQSSTLNCVPGALSEVSMPRVAHGEPCPAECMPGNGPSAERKTKRYNSKMRKSEEIGR